MVPSPTPARRRPTRAQTREQVLRAAVDVFSEHGYERATLDDIAAAAGLTKGAIYSSFGGKEQLFFEVLKARTDERLDAAGSVAGTHPAAAGLPVGQRLARFTAEDPTWHLAFIEFWASVMRGNDTTTTIADEFAQRRRALRASIAERVPPHSRDDANHLDPAQLAVIVLALSNGLAIEQAIDPEGLEGTFGAALAKLLA